MPSSWATHAGKAVALGSNAILIVVVLVEGALGVDVADEAVLLEEPHAASKIELKRTIGSLVRLIAGFVNMGTHPC